MAESELRWAERFPELGMDPVPIESCVSPEIYAREIDQIFRKVWLYVARDEAWADALAEAERPVLPWASRGAPEDDVAA